MKNLSIKRPEQQYCGFQQRGEDELLGFLTPFGTDQAFEKRKYTVDSWAKEATDMMENFKTTTIQYAEKKSCVFIITGHIHKPELGLLYGNCGDWVENCSAIVERQDGTLGLIFWHDK